MKITEKALIKWIIILTPMIDILNGLVDALEIGTLVSFGQMLRAILLLLLLYFLAFESAKKELMVIVLVIILFFRNLFIAFTTGESIVVNVAYDIRYIYVLTFLLLLTCASDRGYIQRKECIRWAESSVLIFTYTILVCRIFDIGLNYVGANKGFFKEQNSLTALLVYGCSIWLYKAFIKEKGVLNKINVVLICFATLSQATKTGFLGLACCLIYVVIYSGAVKKRWFKSIVLCFLGILAGYFMFLYFKKGEGSVVLTRWQYFIERLDAISFLLSGRNTAFTVALEIWINKLVFIFFGTSYVYGSKLVLEINPTLAFGGPEMDMFDILYYYGVFIGFFVLVPIVKQFIVSVRGIFITTSIRPNYYNFSYAILCIISFLGGHVLSSPMAGVFFAVAFVSVSKNNIDEKYC